MIADDLLRFASSLEGVRLTTQARGAAFRVRVLPDGLETTPESSGVPRFVGRRVIQSVLDRHAASGSTSPAEYLDVTFDSSYLLAVISRLPTNHAGTSDGPPLLLGTRFDAAVALALDLHRTQLRKGTSVPYVSHLLAVASLVLEDGGDEDEAVAAVLHDALEDRGDQISPMQLEERFGRRVRELVEACTDTPPDYRGGEKPDWKSRKARYLAHLANGSAALRVSLADKLHNARCILRDLRHEGEAVWDRFTAPKGETLWYYRALVGAYRSGGAEGFMIDELERVVSEMERRAGGPSAGHRPGAVEE